MSVSSPHPCAWPQAFESLHEAVLGVTEDDRLCYLNPAARRLLAWPEERPAEGTLIELFHPVDGLELGPEGRLAARICEHTELTGGRPLRQALRRQDEVVLEMEVTASTLLSEAGERCHVILLRRPPELVDFDGGGTRLRAGRERPEPSWQLVFENAPVGIFHFDNRGVITACNERFVENLGSSRQMLIGLDMRTLPNAEIVRCVEQAVAGERTIYDGDYTSVTGGRHRIVRVAFSPILSEEGEVESGVGIVEDITDARRAQQVLSRADRMASLGTLAAGIAHEINNPLAYVMASLEYALRTLPRSSRALEQTEVAGGKSWLDIQRDALGNALEGTERVRRIVSDLGTFSRPAALAEGSSGLSRVLDSAAALAWNEIRHRAHLVKNYGETPRVRGEEPRLVQVFLNLLLNAAQAIPDGDAEHNLIEVGVTRTESGVIVEVRDTGGGIAPDVIDHIFEPFFTTKETGRGTGLGLSVCHGIVSSLGGTISAHPSAGGTTMRVLLPEARPETRPEEERVVRREPRPTYAVSPLRMLFIDDEERLAETLAIALSPHEVVSATSGGEALSLLERDRDFVLVLCDLMIPDLSGPEIYQKVLQRDPELAARFVFVSGGAFTERARDQLARIDVPLVNKPFDIETIEDLLEDRRDSEAYKGHGI
ncbi:MAG: ATP-binding protein [Deltaproteobacteria bacterium]|nr:ATP-binding protein [Deltaproteobacteria bacterium]